MVAGRALGAGDGRVIFRHILPNALAPVLVSITFGIANAILIEAALSFLGFGVQPPTPSWGGMLARAQEYLEWWWITLFPGLAIFLAVTGYNMLGEGLRDATDPRVLLADVLRSAVELLSLPDNDFSWSSWENREAAVAEVQTILELLERGELPDRVSLSVLFAATGPIQEVSLSSGWSETFLKVAERFDRAERRLAARY